MKFIAPLLICLAFTFPVSAEDPKTPALLPIPKETSPAAKEIIGRVAANRYILPTNQVITPAGIHAALPGLRPQALALSPNGRLLVTAGNGSKLYCLNPITGAVRQEVTFAPDAPPPPSKDKKPKDKDAKDKDAKDKDAKGKDSKEKDAKDKDAKDSKEKDPRGKDPKDKDAKEKDVKDKDAKENVSEDKDAKDEDSKEKDDKEKEKEAKEKEAKEKAAKEKPKRNLSPPKPAKPAPASGSALSLTGLVFSPNGTRIYLSNVVGTVKVFSVDGSDSVKALTTFPIPEAKTSKRKPEIPTGLTVSADGTKLYVVGNLGNRLHEMNAETGAVLRSWDTGVAPFDVVLVGQKAYVSNSGGRRPDKDDKSAAPAGAGAKVRVDSVRHIANEGTVTVVDLAANSVKGEIPVELHASALALSPDKQYLVVTNTGSDTLSVIDTNTDAVVEKIWARRTPGDLFGAQPGAVTFDGTGKRLYVCNGTQNSVAVIKFDPKENESAVVGLIPVGWFPGAVVFDAPRKTVCVANIKGIGAGKQFKPGEKVKFNTKEFFGSLSLVPAPSGNAMDDMTAVSLLNMRYVKLTEAAQPPRPNQPPRAVPERVGEPSLIKHVVYVIKENRTYDQVLGDIKTGNGDPSLCVFGEKITPNLHKICREFVLLDNTFCCSVQSADGHQWTDSAIANGYMERQVGAGFPRSYPGGKMEDGLDALAWSSSGFIWDNVIARGKTFRNYGEWMLSEAGWKDPKDPKNPKKDKEKPKWEDFWADYKHGTGLTKLASRPGIETLRAVSKLDTVGWDLNVTDQMRVDAFISELKEFEMKGNFPDFCMVFLPNDHTGGTRGKTPTPAAQVADNDLAMGRLVEAITHSKFWSQTAIFAIEDDPQAGWDHVSAYRTTCYVVSPYTKRRKTISTPYNHPGLLRTMELMLGLPPMNQMDASATPMTDCFTNIPDLTPFKSVPNTTPLDTFNPDPKKVTHVKLREDAIASANLPLEVPDKCPEDELNQILWRAMKGPDVPYPVWAVKKVEDDDDD
ncbi:MAG TPA: alkaline phosphatase family protein [Verrucomicrobiales bacterium]|nr:alkaline phosphatase family protein [Verrucomicrobiales bacterium]